MIKPDNSLVNLPEIIYLHGVDYPSIKFPGGLQDSRPVSPLGRYINDYIYVSIEFADNYTRYF